MARPNSPTPRTTLRMLGLMAVLAALLGLVATGCGTEKEDKATGDKQEQTETDGTGTEDEAAEDGDATEDDEAAKGDEAAEGAEEEGDAAEDEG